MAGKLLGKSVKIVPVKTVLVQKKVNARIAHAKSK